jgi:hypothetical protein
MVIFLFFFIFVELLELVKDHGTKRQRVKDVSEVVVRETVIDREI